MLRKSNGLQTNMGLRCCMTLHMPLGWKLTVSLFHLLAIYQCSVSCDKNLSYNRGGALTFKDAYSKERADSLRNFGIQGIDNITEPGINGKLNEVQAAVGILLLKMVEDEIEKGKNYKPLSQIARKYTRNYHQQGH